MECFLTELKGTVKSECEDPRGVIDQAIAFMEHGIKKLVCLLTLNQESTVKGIMKWVQTD